MSVHVMSSPTTADLARAAFGPPTFDVLEASRPTVLERLEPGRVYRNDRLHTPNRSHKLPDPWTVRCIREVRGPGGAGLWHVHRLAGPALGGPGIAERALPFWREVTDYVDETIEGG